MFHVKIIRDPDAWSNCLLEFGVWDIGHTYEFHALSEKNDEGLPILFVVVNEFAVPIMIWPGLLREIKDCNGVDITSVYGYSGPVIKSTVRYKECIEAVIDKMHAVGVVAVFARMHPILGEGFAELNSDCAISGKVVLIDVAKQKETLESYSSGLRYDIRKLRHLGLKVEVDEHAKHIDQFRSMYIDAMKHLDADKYYFFKKNYFSKLINTRRWATMLIFARYDGTRIGAGLFIVANNIMHYYLGASVEKYRKLSPLKLVLEKAHEIAIEQGLDYVMLGGGVGSREDDLFRFKKRFGKLVQPFYLLKTVVNEKLYVEICEKNDLRMIETEFFPTYRAPFVDDLD